MRLDFVVQALNYAQMPDAVRLMHSFGFDGTKFQMLRSWGTYSPEEFARHDVGSPGHPEFQRFLAVLDDGALRDRTVEFYGFHSVSADRRAAGEPFSPSRAPAPPDRSATSARRFLLDHRIAAGQPEVRARKVRLERRRAPCREQGVGLGPEGDDPQRLVFAPQDRQPPQAIDVPGQIGVARRRGPAAGDTRTAGGRHAAR